MKVLIFYRHFPVAMGRYYQWGLEEAGHEVYSVGPYSHGRIPWGVQFFYPDYKYPPDLELPDVPMYPIKDVLEKAKFKPDLIIQAADTYSLIGKAPVPNILIGTDPHVVDYRPMLTNVDYYFSCQKCYQYGLPNEGWLPYGYVGGLHRYLPDETINYQVVFSGLQYEYRKDFLRAMTDKGYRVYNSLGDIYEDYVKIYNQGLLAFNWSSQNDLPARFWEGMAMKRCMLTNRVPDLKEFDFVEGVDYLGFSTLGEAVEKADYYLKYPKYLLKIASNGWWKVRKHNYKNRVIAMIKELKEKKII